MSSNYMKAQTKDFRKKSAEREKYLLLGKPRPELYNAIPPLSVFFVVLSFSLSLLPLTLHFLAFFHPSFFLDVLCYLAVNR